MKPFLMCLAITGIVFVVIAISVANERPASSGRAPSETPITLTGSRIQDTKPFKLAGGSYTIDWSATADASGSCYHGGSLRSTTGTYSDHFVSDGPKRGGPATVQGEANVYRVPAGEHYLSMSSGCESWSVTIKPQ